MAIGILEPGSSGLELYDPALWKSMRIAKQTRIISP